MNSLGCRLCLKKGKCAFVNALLIPELCKSIKTFFGFEILMTDRCSTKVCSECISLITDALSYKNRVLYNQECIQKDILFQAQIQSIKVEEDSDDIIFVENETQNQQDELSQVTSSQVSPMTIKVKQTARKSTTKLPFHIYPPRPTPKELCPKKLKVVCEPLNEKEIKRFCATKRSREVRRSRKNEPKRTPQRTATVHSTPRNQSLEKRLENIFTGSSPKTAETNALESATPKVPQPKVNLTKSVYSQSPSRKSSNVKPTATVNPSDPKQQKVAWCGQISITNNSGMTNTTKSPHANSTKNVMRSILPKQQGETTIRKITVPAIRKTLPTVTITRTPVSTTVQDSPLRAALIKKSDPYHVASPAPQMNVVNTVYLNNSPPQLGSTLICRPNTGLNITPAGTSVMPQNSVSMMNGHTYAIPYSSPTFNLNYKNGILTSKPQLQYVDNGLSPQMNINVMDKALAQNKVKVLSVNELNTRLSSPSGPTTISHEAAFKSQRLPIRISLTKVRNEMTIKLTDSQGSEIKFNDLDESEAIAVRTSLLSKESIRNFGQAFKTCSPDAYTLHLLNKLGLNKASFLSLLPM